MKSCFACVGASVALIASSAWAGPPASHTEGPDAGQTIATAQSTSGMGLLNLIRGSLSTGFDVDMFCINIANPMGFTATSADLGFDTQLWLFRPDGTGVTADDDSGGGFFNSFIDGQLVTSSGLYYLAITKFDQDALDINGDLIWAAGNDPSAVPISNLPLGSWNGNTTGAGFDYEIRLTGVDFSNCSVVIPLPTGGLLGLAGLGAMASIRRRRMG